MQPEMRNDIVINSQLTRIPQQITKFQGTFARLCDNTSIRKVIATGLGMHKCGD